MENDADIDVIMGAARALEEVHETIRDAAFNSPKLLQDGFGRGHALLFMERFGIAHESSEEIAQRRLMAEALSNYRSALIRKMDDDQIRVSASYVNPWVEEPTGPDVGYMIRTSSHSGMDHVGTFAWPWSGYVEAAPDSIYGFLSNGDAPSARGGLYGLLDGIGDWTQIMGHPMAVWQVMAVKRSECRPSPTEWAHRAPRGWVVYSGDAAGAFPLILPKMLSSPRLSEMTNGGPPPSAPEDCVLDPA